MTDISVLSSTFESSTSLKTNVSLTNEDINVPVVHQVVKALLANKRQGTASTKVRSEVRGGGKKPFKQKGTGRARQGSNRSPLMPGGGIAFGPKPRSYEQKLNKKVVEKAIQSVVADKLQSGKLTVLESFNASGKTKDIFNDLNSRNLLPALIVTNDKNSMALRAVRNIKNGYGIPVEGFSVYEALKYENLIIEKEALDKLLQRLV